VTGLWDDTSTNFRRVVGRLNESLRAVEAGFVVRVDHHTTDVFPFRGWASFSPASSPGDEQLVLSLDFKRDGNEIHGHVDLARGDGLVLADEQVVGPFDETSIDAPDAIRRAEKSVSAVRGGASLADPVRARSLTAMIPLRGIRASATPATSRHGEEVRPAGLGG
jgi:hypothetical protein